MSKHLREYAGDDFHRNQSFGGLLQTQVLVGQRVAHEVDQGEDGHQVDPQELVVRKVTAQHLQGGHRNELDERLHGHPLEALEAGHQCTPPFRQQPDEGLDFEYVRCKGGCDGGLRL